MNRYAARTYNLVNQDGDVLQVLDRDSLLPRFAWVDQDLIRWFAAGWGIDPDLPYRDLQTAVYEENGRRSPCRDCGLSHHGSTDPWRCDECLDDQVRQQERRELNREIHKRRRDEARLAKGRLSPGRRQLIDLAGIDFGSADEVNAEAYGEHL